ncbi:hypothetical protein MXD61_23705 [Frankia sp. AgPm24]|nr:hypothetical protein [Frankia sp. AgPm24]
MVHEEPGNGDRSALDALNSADGHRDGEALAARDARAARGAGAAPSGVGRRRNTVRADTAWGDRLLTLCVAAGLVVLFTVPRTWARATLSDRGAHLLVATRSGWDLAPTGALVGAAAVLAIVLSLLAGWTGRRGLASAVLACGLAIVALALGRLDAATPLEHTIGRLRIGTFQTDEPVTHSGPAAWLWVAVTCGAVMAGAAASSLALGRRRPPVNPAGGPGEGSQHRGV